MGRPSLVDVKVEEEIAGFDIGRRFHMRREVLKGYMKKAPLVLLLLLEASPLWAQALVDVPELSPVKALILLVLDVYGAWKLLMCIKNVFDHLGDSSKGDTTAKERVWNSVMSFIGILMVGVLVNVLILKAGQFGAKPVSSFLSGN